MRPTRGSWIGIIHNRAMSSCFSGICEGLSVCPAGKELCVFDFPTDQKTSIEDVVVGSSFRGHGFGRALIEHIFGATAWAGTGGPEFDLKE